MRIAVPELHAAVSNSLAGSDGFRFFEDDHGRIIRSFFVAAEHAGDVRAAVAQLEQYGVDALLCGDLPGEEKLETAAAGLMLFPGYAGAPEDAALSFLSGAVARDPNNKCNACGFQTSCSLHDRGGCGNH